MKKLFSLAMVTGMLLLMSFSGSAVERNVSKIGMEDGEYVNCWLVADAAAAASEIFGGASYDESMLVFDYVYNACTHDNYGTPGSSCQGC